MQAGALWGAGGGVLPTEPQPSRGNRQRFGLVVTWLGFLVVDFFCLVWGFFTLLQMSFIITHAFSDMEKAFLTSNTLLILTMSKHLVFTSFPPPNYFAVRNSSPPHSATSTPSFPRRLWLGKPAPAWSVPAPLPLLMPPAPVELGMRPPETPGSPAFGMVEMSPWPQRKGLETAGSSDGEGKQGRCSNTLGAAGHSLSAQTRVLLVG